MAKGRRKEWSPKLQRLRLYEAYDDIREQMARTFWVMAWAQREEEEGRVPGGPGVDLMDAAPETENVAYEKADEAILDLEKANNLALTEMYGKALDKSDLEDADRHRSDFGHYLVMESLGTGVAWSDDHEDHDLEVPYTEFIL